MCITFFYIDTKPSPNAPYKLIIAFNRDEFIDRPTQALHHWKDDPNIIGGRDLSGKGTWLGVNLKTGNVAFLTNLRKPFLKKIFEPAKSTSRGTILFNFLKTSFYGDRGISLENCDNEEIEKTIVTYMKEILKQAKDYEPFNLVLGNLKSMTFKYMNNRTPEEFPISLEDGPHAMTNCPKNEMWPKSERGLAMFKEIHKECTEKGMKQEELVQKLDEMMKDTTKFSIFDFTETSIFIKPYKVWFNEARATKTTSIVLVNDKNEIKFVEHTNNVHKDQLLGNSPVYSTVILDRKVLE